MANGLPYYKRYPRDFIEGTIGMPFEVKSAYSIVLDLIYMQGGSLPDDAHYIAGLLTLSVRKWKSIRQALIDAGKLHVVGNFLTNDRANVELAAMKKYSEQQANRRRGDTKSDLSPNYLEIISKLSEDKNAEKSTEPHKNSQLQKPRSNHTEPESYTEESPPIVPPADAGGGGGQPKKRPRFVADLTPKQKTVMVEKMQSHWNEICGDVLPKVRVVSDEMRKNMLARGMAEFGGREGEWVRYCKLVRATPFLRGEVGRAGWRATLDWVIRPRNYAKIANGNWPTDSEIGANGAALHGGDNPELNTPYGQALLAWVNGGRQGPRPKKEVFPHG